MPADLALIAWVAEAMEPIGRVTHRAMMGGAMLYLDGTVFGLIDGEGVLRFKSDDLLPGNYAIGKLARQMETSDAARPFYRGPDHRRAA